jgi:hypothetical protein
LPGASCVRSDHVGSEESRTGRKSRAKQPDSSEPAGLGNVDLYTSTRHYFGWYAWNVLELDARDIALHFGHQDGGELVRKLYGHPDAALARERVREAFRQAPTAPIPLAATAS